MYNRALRYIGERGVTLTEESEARELLDDVWDDGGVNACLEEAMWKFATRTVKLDYDTSVDPEFGYQRAFQKPTDWVLTVAFCSDEHCTIPITRYHHENDYWYCDLDEIYVRYVSNHADYGNALSLWPDSFASFVAAHFAKEIVDDLTSNPEIVQRVEQRYEENRGKAKNRDAWNQPQAFPAVGSWARSRGQLSPNNRDRGSRSSLTG